MSDTNNEREQQLFDSWFWKRYGRKPDMHGNDGDCGRWSAWLGRAHLKQEPALLLQDENSGREGRRYNEWHASRPDARMNAREAAAALTPHPETPAQVLKEGCEACCETGHVYLATHQPQPEPTSKGVEDELRESVDSLRRALEIIAVGDSQDPVRDAGDELVALGYWSAEAVAQYRAAHASQQRETQEAAEPIPTGVHYGGQFDNFYDSATLAGMGTDFWLRWKHRRDEFPTAPQEAGKAEKCKTCNGHGLIGGFVSDGDGGGGYDSEPCPECNSKEASKVEPVADERQPSDGDYLRWAEQAGAKVNWDFESASSARVVFLTASQWGRFCDKVRALYLRPSQQALGDEQISEWALRMFEMDAIDIEIELRRILAAAGGSEK